MVHLFGVSVNGVLCHLQGRTQGRETALRALSLQKGEKLHSQQHGKTQPGNSDGSLSYLK